MRVFVVLLVAACASACGGTAPRPVPDPASPDALIFWITDGIDAPTTGAIAGDFQNSPAAIEGSNEIIHAVTACAPTFTVNRDYSHHTYVLITSEEVAREPQEIFSCVKARMTGHFSAGIGSPDELPGADQSQFEEFHAQTH